MSLSVDPRIGSELFGYRLEALLGRGGMSVVYRAYDLALDRKVALKLLAPELAGDERFRSRFLKESRMAASLDHPNVIPIYEAGEAEGLLCIAMRYVEGTDLKRLLHEQGALDPVLALDYCAQVASALDAAHERGLVHRDVKPSNVLIARGGHCYLADFGLGQDAADRGDLTQTGQMLGSVDYAAPEQIEGKKVDGRADVYSLGCLLYECLTGSVPFAKDSDLAVLWAHVHEPPPSVDAHPTLTPMVKRALAKRPDDRYQTCQELVQAARAALPKPEQEPPRRRRLAIVALVVLVLAGALAAGLALTLTGGTKRAAPSLVVRSNTLVRIDPNTNQVVARTPVGAPAHLLPGAGDVAVGRRTVWVYNWYDQNIYVLDPRTNTVLRIVPIQGTYIQEQWNSIAADSGGAWALSGQGDSGSLWRILPGVSNPRPTPLKYDPLAVAAGAGVVWVAAKNGTNEVILRIDPSTGSILRTRHLSGGDVQSIAIGDGALWLLQDGSISRLDPRTGELRHRLPLPGWNVFQIAVGGAGVWATMRRLPNGPYVLVHVDAQARHVLNTIPEPSARSDTPGTRLAVGDEAVWWNSTAGTIWRIDPVAGKVVRAIHVTPEVAFSADVAPIGIATGDGAVWTTVTVGP